MGLLKGIDPLLSADLLYVLRAAGHGDMICICDCNFPARTVAEETTTKKLVQMNGCSLDEACKAIYSVLPLDCFQENRAFFMSPQDGMQLPRIGEEVQAAARAALELGEGEKSGATGVDRFKFYDLAKQCFAVVQTAERRPYGNVILVKGCVGPDGKDLKPGTVDDL